MTHVAVLVGSLRADSVNRQVAESLRDLAPDGVTIDIVDGIDQLPFYNEDIDGDAVPEAVTRVRELVGRSDRVLAVTPEYNATMPAVLNAFTRLNTESALTPTRCSAKGSVLSSVCRSLDRRPS